MNGILKIREMAVFKRKKLPSQLSTSRYASFEPQSQNADARKMADLSMWDNDQSSRRAEPEKPKISLVSILISASALLVLGFTCYFLVDKFMVKSPTKIPLISAPKGPYKIRPQDPGGITFPHQDKFVYGKIAPSKQKVTERVLPQAERPIPLPQPVKPVAMAAVAKFNEPAIQQPASAELNIVANHLVESKPPEPQPAPRGQLSQQKPTIAVRPRSTAPKAKPHLEPVLVQPVVASTHVVKPVTASTHVIKPPPAKPAQRQFDDDFAKLVSGRDNPSRSSSIVIPANIPSDSPLHAAASTANPKAINVQKMLARKVRYRLQLATLPSLPAANQERDLLISASGLSSAKFEVQGFTNSSGQIVYRIFYGKYKSEKRAQKARKILIKKGLHPIILRME